MSSNTNSNLSSALTDAGTTSRSIWFIAGTLAIAVHMAAGLWFIDSTSPARAGAIDLGEQGIEVGLGLAGSFTQSISQPEPEQEMTEPEEPVEPETLPEPPPPEPIVKPVETKVPPKIATVAKAELADIAPKVEPQPTPLVEPPQPRPQPDLTQSTPKPAQNKPHSVAQQQATGSKSDQRTGGSKGDYKNYYSKLMAWLNRHKTYPKQAKKNKKQGVVTVRFTVARNGQLLTKKLEKSSGIEELDQAALAMLDKASPVPKIPKKFNKETLTVVIPIEYSLITH